MPALPMFPLQSVVLPGEELPLRIFEPRYRQLLADVLAADRRFGTVLIEAGREVGGGERRFDVGVAVTVTGHRRLGFGQHAVSARAGSRIRVRAWLPDDPYPRAEVEDWPDEPAAVIAEQIRAVQDRLLELYRRAFADRRVVGRPPPEFTIRGEDPTTLLYAIAAKLGIGAADRYALLAAASVPDRLAVLTDAITTIEARMAFGTAD